jgi:hypothetical protein
VKQFLDALAAFIKQYPFVMPLLGSLGTITVFLIRPFAARIRRDKQFSYRLLNDEPFHNQRTTIDFDALADLRASALDGDRLVILQVINDGQQPLRPEDFVRPVKTTFGHGSAIVGGPVVLDGEPGDLDLAITQQGEQVVFSPLLLNPNDWAIVGLVVRGGVGINVSGRIVGIERIHHYRRDDLVFAAQMVTMLTVFFSIYLFAMVRPNTPLTQTWPWVLLSFVCFFLAHIWPNRESRVRVNRYRSRPNNWTLPFREMFWPHPDVPRRCGRKEVSVKDKDRAGGSAEPGINSHSTPD